jgi:hypothetical protein
VTISVNCAGRPRIALAICLALCLAGLTQAIQILLRLAAEVADCRPALSSARFQVLDVAGDS